MHPLAFMGLTLWRAAGRGCPPDALTELQGVEGVRGGGRSDWCGEESGGEGVGGRLEVEHRNRPGEGEEALPKTATIPAPTPCLPASCLSHSPSLPGRARQRWKVLNGNALSGQGSRGSSSSSSGSGLDGCVGSAWDERSVEQGAQSKVCGDVSAFMGKGGGARNEGVKSPPKSLRLDEEEEGEVVCKRCPILEGKGRALALLMHLEAWPTHLPSPSFLPEAPAQWRPWTRSPLVPHSYPGAEAGTEEAAGAVAGGAGGAGAGAGAASERGREEERDEVKVNRQERTPRSGPSLSLHDLT